MAHRTESVDTRPMSWALMLSKTFSRPILSRIVSFARETSSETTGCAVGRMNYEKLLDHKKYIARVLTKRRRVMSIAKAGAFKCRDVVLHKVGPSYWGLGFIVKKNELTAEVQLHQRYLNSDDRPVVPYHKLRRICSLYSNVKVVIANDDGTQTVRTGVYLNTCLGAHHNPYYEIDCLAEDGYQEVIGITAQKLFYTRTTPLPLEGHIPCEDNDITITVI